MLKFYLSSLSFLLLIFCFNTQHLRIPPVACPNYFQYFIENSQYIGKISIPTISNTIELLVYFSQKQPLQTNYYGRISLESRDPIVYRVEFPSPIEVPKLTKITVNGQDICVSNEYSAPSTRLYLNHKLQITTQALNSNSPQQFPLNPQTLQQFPTSGVQIQPTREVAQFSDTPTQIFNNKFTPETNNNNNVIQPIRQNAQCGLGNTVTAFVFGGEEVMRGEFPWLTAIYVKSAGLRFLCGGSLISSRTVVSAGHCFKIGSIAANRLVINLGRHNLEDFSEQGFVTREIENLIVHPEYNSNLFPDADLAILHLKQPVQFTNNIRPICLWTDNIDTRYIEGQAGVVAGWGADEQGRTFTPVPKKVDTKIVSDAECLRSSPAYNMLTSPRTFCAGNRDDTGPCMGDSGSGLMISRNGRWYLRGIVSAGQTKDRKCNLQEFVVFCDVAKHMQWIQSNLVS
ncbi:serine protease gd-like [Lucilia cuprina]|uniref:serine protease gd-like n=1 Tax=Lucilia cuprina TaxID=7375 RepID=UPI001F06F032|nr:serine protease gd-like [Lucilia cuprina]